MSELFTDLAKTDIKKEDVIFILWELSHSPCLTQRELSLKLNISLGKTNYLLKELSKKGIIKIKNFSRKSGKIKRAKYILTSKGLKEKAVLTHQFLTRKEREYNCVKEMWKEVRLEKYSA